MRSVAQVNRRLAIKQGLCTNYWKCHNPASAQGRMCDSCHEEYLQKHPGSTTGQKGSLNVQRPLPVEKAADEPGEPVEATDPSQ